MSGCFRRQNGTGSTGRSKKLKTHGRPIEKNNGQSKTGRPQEKNSGESKSGRAQEKSSGESKTGRPQEKSSGQRLTGRITDQKMHGPWEKEEQEELVEENNISKIDRIETGSFARLLQENDVPAEPWEPWATFIWGFDSFFRDLWFWWFFQGSVVLVVSSEMCGFDSFFQRSVVLIVSAEICGFDSFFRNLWFW